VFSPSFLYDRETKMRKIANLLKKNRTFIRCNWGTPYKSLLNIFYYIFIDLLGIDEGPILIGRLAFKTA